MTDFTDNIETTAASIEDLQEDLEAHLEDILGVAVTANAIRVGTDTERPTELCLYAELEDLENQLEDRLGGDIDVGELDLSIRLSGDHDAR